MNHVVLGHSKDVDDMDAIRGRDSLIAEWSGKSASRNLGPVLGYNRAIQDSRMTFASFVETKFIPEHVEHKTAVGRTHYQAILKHLLRPEKVHQIFNPNAVAKPRLKSQSDWPYLDDVQLCELRSDHIRQIISAAFAHDYSPQTVKHIRTVIFAIVSHAQREGCFSGPNPVTQVKLPPMRRKVEHNLNITQTTAMLELMQYPEREIALFTICTGMNIREICELRWGAVNLGELSSYLDGEIIPPNSIAIRRQWNRVGLGDNKRDHPRNIEISELLFATLQGLKRHALRTDPSDLVLVSSAGTPIDPATIRVGRLKPIGKRLGLPWLSWQVLRRAHTVLLSEFRYQLNSQMANVIQEGPENGYAVFGDPGRALTSRSSGRIGPKSRCRSFPFVRGWRN